MLAHRLAAFEHDGLEAHLRQHQRREDAAGTEADDERTFVERVRRPADEAVVHVRCGREVRVVAEFLQQRGLVADRHVNRVDQQQRVLLARVVGALVDAHAEERRIGQLEAGEDGGAQGVRRMVERQFEFGQSQHVGSSG